MEVKAWKELKERGNRADKKQSVVFEGKDGEAYEEAAEFYNDYIEIPSFSEVTQDKVACKGFSYAIPGTESFYWKRDYPASPKNHYRSK